MTFQTKSTARFADIISFCSDGKSDQGLSPRSKHTEALMESLSFHSKSPSTFSGESNAWSSPVEKEALELSNRKRTAVLNMIEKNWKINIRTKIETDLTNQVQQALAPLSNLKKRAEKKKLERQKNFQIFKVQHYNRGHLPSHNNTQSNSTSSNFKYIDVSYIPQNKFLTGRSDGFYAKDTLPKSLSSLRLPKRNELLSQSISSLDEMTRAKKHARNIRGGLDVTLLESQSNTNLFPFCKYDENELRSLVPKMINYNGITLPNYGANRRCFQTYTKEGMNNLLSSRARMSKLTSIGDGKFLDKRGVIISRLGPFWPQGYGPVCQCPEFIIDCPLQEDLNPLSDCTQPEQTRSLQPDQVKPPSSSAWQAETSPRIKNPADNMLLKAENIKTTSANPTNAIPVMPTPTSNTELDSATQNFSNKNSFEIDQSTNNFKLSNIDRDDLVLNRLEEVNQSDKIQKSLSEKALHSQGDILKTTPRLTPRDLPLKPPISQTNKRIPGQVTGKPTWKGKPVIYDCDRSSRSPLPHSVPDGLDQSLVFESRFESGNLRQVRRIGEHEYELVLRTDMYTNRHTQWYYFRIQKAKANRIYKFSIINFLKKDSLYNYGMKPLVYSQKLAEDYKLGWHRIGEKIRYFAWHNPTRNAILSLDLQYYCLEFEVAFDWDEIEEDTVYLAHCYPYTYSDLRRHLDNIMCNPDLSLHVKKEVLCETTAGNACFLLTITEFPDREKDKYKDFHQEKRGVVITARVHPGETQSSWMMKGVIEHLVSDHPIAVQLRKKFVFKIVPMLNPDGVIVGNYRTSLAARDLNRNYRHPRQEIFPTIWHTKQMVDQFNKDHPIILYCDLHGHSRKHMIFMYGCERKAFYQPPKNNKKQNTDNDNIEKPDSKKTSDGLDETRDFVEERMFPWLMHKLAPTSFSFHGTKFAVRRSKEATGRVVMFRQMKIWNSFTMEASFSGTRMDKGSGRHFNIDDFQLIGRKLCDCVLKYSIVCENPRAKSRAILDMTKSIAEQLLRCGKLSDSVKKDAVNNERIVDRSNVAGRKSQVPNRSNPATTFLGSTPNLANIKSTISKQSRKNQTKKKPNQQQQKQTNKNSDDDIIDDVTMVVDENLDDSTQAPFTEYQPSTVGLYEDSSPASDSGDLDAENLDSNELSSNENCFRLLRSFNLCEIDLESESSSESNSDSEPELPEEVGSSAKFQSSLGNSSVGKKKKRKKRQQKYGKSISAPSKVQALQNGAGKRFSEDQQYKENKNKNIVTNYPGYVNKYANRSNGGIPIFAQERMEERAARRLAELKSVEKDRRIQENQLREQLLLAGIQNGANISYDMSMTRRIPDEHSGYSEVCGVRYKVANHLQRVHYMLSNPYRGNSPNSNRDRRPVITMRFSPPSQLHHTISNENSKSLKDDYADHELYMPYRVQAAAGRLSNQRGLSTLTELSGSPSDSNLIELPSSQSSEKEDFVDTSSYDQYTPPVGGKIEPRSVVVPVQKYNVSFNMCRKTWKQKRNGSLTSLPHPPEIDDSEVVLLQHDTEDHVHGRSRNIPELILPPNMDVADVLTAHMRYPAQVHRIEAMRPLPRGRTISRGPPMVFGEPVPFKQKSGEIIGNDSINLGPDRLDKPNTIPSIHYKHKSKVFSKQTNHYDVTLHETQAFNNEIFAQQSVENQSLSREDITKQLSPRHNPQSLFVPRFIAMAPQRDDSNEEITCHKGNSTDRMSDELSVKERGRQPFTVR